MSTFDRRRPLSPPEELAAIGAGLAVGAAVWYFARTMLHRQPMRLSESPIPGESPTGTPAVPTSLTPPRARGGGVARRG